MVHIQLAPDAFPVTSIWVRLTLTAIAAALLGQMLINFAEHDRGQEKRAIPSFQILGEGGGFRVLGEVFKPAGGIDYIEVRSAPSGHDTRLSIASPWRFPGVP